MWLFRLWLIEVNQGVLEDSLSSQSILFAHAPCFLNIFVGTLVSLFVWRLLLTQITFTLDSLQTLSLNLPANELNFTLRSQGMLRTWFGKLDNLLFSFVLLLW